MVMSLEASEITKGERTARAKKQTGEKTHRGCLLKTSLSLVLHFTENSGSKISCYPSLNSVVGNQEMKRTESI